MLAVRCGRRITVDGDAGDFAGCEMRGGFDLCQSATRVIAIGSAYPGSKKGMTDGTILIGGDVGSEAGASMRRDAGGGGIMRRWVGFNMIAGGILVFGFMRAFDRGGACGEARSDSLERHNPAVANLRAAGLFPPPFSPASLSRATRLGFPGDQELLTTGPIARPRRSGRTRKRRNLDENQLTQRTTDSEKKKKVKGKRTSTTDDGQECHTEYFKIAGGTGSSTPANGIDGQVRDIWISGGKIVAAPDRSRSVRPARVHRRPRPGRHARRCRHALSYRRFQGQHRAEIVPRAESTAAVRSHGQHA